MNNGTAITKILFLLFFLLSTDVVNAQNTAKVSLPQSSLDGRWDITFDIPQQQYRTILEFNILSEGKSGTDKY